MANNVLETLYLLLECDASQLKAALKELNKDNKDTQKSLTDTDTAANKLNKTFLDLGERLAGLVAGYFAIDTILDNFRQAINYGAQLQITSEILNVNSARLEAWGNAVRRTGGTAQEFQSTLKTLAQNFGTTPEVMLGRLPQLADQLHRMGNFQAFNYGRLLGLDDHTILLLRMGSAGIRELMEEQKRLGIPTQQQIKLTQDFNFELGNTAQTYSALAFRIGQDILPKMILFQKTIQDINIFLRQHVHFAEAGFAIVAASILRTAGVLKILKYAFTALGGEFTIIFGLISFLAAELEGYFNGEDNMLSRAIKKWPELGKAIKFVGDELKSFSNYFDSLSDPKIQQQKRAEANRRLDITNIQSGIPSLPGALDKLAFVHQSPLNVIPSTIPNIFGGNNRSLASTVNIQSLVIQTEATDADGIASTIQTSLRKQLSFANNNFTDGRAL